ncbi:hypothetical protein [Streptomyces sp. NPDC051665]|uniref:hypothetical protein n=1 Tax=Streptomyces sp. NPDC051665 TaxID=3154647 RepID=UPI003427F7CE
MTAPYVIRTESIVEVSSESVAVTGAGTAINNRSDLVAVLPEVIEVDYNEGAEILDRVARRKLGISGPDFITKWDAGEYDTPEENIKAQEVAALIPLVRPTKS